MEITISLGKNFKISDKALEEFKNMVKEGRCLGTIGHPEPNLSLMDISYKVNDIKENNLGELLGDITILNNQNGETFKEMIQKYPNCFRFSPTGFCHKEINPETGEEETVVDVITSIDATFKETIDVNEFLAKLYDLHKDLASCSSTKKKNRNS